MKTSDHIHKLCFVASVLLFAQVMSSSLTLNQNKEEKHESAHFPKGLSMPALPIPLRARLIKA